ncbi:MAG: hypothetical protein ACRERC_07520, partial [Candidatus Binatia bacterium]
LLALGRGRDGWRRCLGEVAWTAAGGAAVCLPLCAHAVWRSSFAEMYYATVTWVLTNYSAANVGRMGWAGSLFRGGGAHTWLPLLRALPAVLGLELLSLVWDAWRGGLAAQRVRASLWLLAATAAAAILYFPDIIHIAFVAPFGFVVLAGMIARLRRLRPLRTAVGRVALQVAWAALLALVLGQAWSNRQRLWQATPEMADSAFGTIAASARQASLLRDLRTLPPSPNGQPYRLFAYPSDAWIYLTLPADNPTPFSLMMPVYSSAAQTQTVIDVLERDRQVAVLVNALFARDADPFVIHVKAHFLPPIYLETQPYVVYRRPPD